MRANESSQRHFTFFAGAKSLGPTTLSGFTATLDLVGNPLTVTRTGTPSETATYTYDNLDRLLSVCYQASCPNGKGVLFGGVRSQHYGTGGGELQLSSMARAGKRGWKVGALKFGNIVGRLTSVAYCG